MVSNRISRSACPASQSPDLKRTCPKAASAGLFHANNQIPNRAKKQPQIPLTQGLAPVCVRPACAAEKRSIAYQGLPVTAVTDFMSHGYGKIITLGRGKT